MPRVHFPKGEIRETGGLHEFAYSEADLERIRNTDTESTKAFKEALHAWYASKNKRSIPKPRIEDFTHYRPTRPKHAPTHLPKAQPLPVPEYTPLPEPVIQPRPIPASPVARRPSHASWVVPLVIAIFICILAITITLYKLSPETTQTLTTNTTVIELANQTVQKSVEESISYANILSNASVYSNVDMSVQGFLFYGIEDGKSTGVREYFVIDDFGRTMRLENVNTYNSLFVKDAQTSTLFLVNGTFKKRFSGPALVVRSISNSSRRTHIIETMVSVSKSETREETKLQPSPEFSISKFFKNIFSQTCEDGTLTGNCSATKPYACSLGQLVKKPEECGCPTEERVYKGECILAVACSDGSYAPECSSNKPFQCVNGSLVSKATICGCPEGYRRNGDACNKIQRCYDNTEYGDCSDNEPFYCNNGNLQKLASKCGCAWGKEVLQEDCVELETAMERKIFDLTNQERTSRGLRALEWSDRLATAARDHSADMARRNYFSHDSPEGSTPLDRFGYGAENIFKMPTGNVEGVGYVSRNSDDLAKAIVNGWMNSPGHRANILNGQLSTLGVGVAYDGSLYYYATQDFGW
jgi:uncharacterized protein YkwD